MTSVEHELEAEYKYPHPEKLADFLTSLFRDKSLSPKNWSYYDVLLSMGADTNRFQVDTTIDHLRGIGQPHSATPLSLTDVERERHRYDMPVANERTTFAESYGQNIAFNTLDYIAAGQGVRGRYIEFSIYQRKQRTQPPVLYRDIGKLVLVNFDAEQEKLHIGSIDENIRADLYELAKEHGLERKRRAKSRP